MLDKVKEISIEHADLIKSFAVFYLLVVGNYVGNSIFTCSQIKFIENRKDIQLFISFLLFYFLVSLVSDTGKLEYTPPIEKLLYAIFNFMGFLLVMRLDMYISIIVLFLIFVIYFIELNKDFYLERGLSVNSSEDQDIFLNNKYWITLNWPYTIRLFPVKKSQFKYINRAENIIYYIIIILLLIGFISYGGEIKDTLKITKNLTWTQVITDTSICNVKDRKSFWHYFKVGLGLKM
jgi:hypothetical protein